MTTKMDASEYVWNPSELTLIAFPLHSRRPTPILTMLQRSDSRISKANNVGVELVTRTRKAKRCLGRASWRAVAVCLCLVMAIIGNVQVVDAEGDIGELRMTACN